MKLPVTRFLLPVLAGLRLFAASALPPPSDMPSAFRADAAATIAAAADVTAGRFPDANSVLLEDRIHTRYEADGSDVAWEDEWVKVLTEKGRRSHAALSLDYNARYGDAGILCVEIVGTNGQVRAVDFARTLKVATDNSSMGANIVDPQDKTLSCKIPGLDVGEIRHVRFWRRTRRSRMKNAWADVQLLESTQPIVTAAITVDQPTARPVRHALVRHPFSNTVVRAADRDLGGGRTLLQWTARDVPQAFPEPNMPSFSRCVQALRLSTIPDWPTVSRWYWGLCEPHLAKTTPAMTNQVRALVKDCGTETEKVRAVFRFVSQEIRYMGLTLEDDAPGYEPHDVNLTFENRYGVCRDKAALLVALLRIAGVRAFPVLIHAGAKMDPEVPTPYFNHAIVAVGSQSNNPNSRTVGRYVLMDPTDESTKDLLPAYLSDRSYLVARPEGEALRTSPVTAVDANMLRVESEGSLDAEGDALLSTVFAFEGINDTAVRHVLLKKTADERRKWFARVWRNVAAGAELLSVEIQPADLRDTEAKLTAKTVTRLPERVLRGTTRDSLTLPFVTRALSIANGILDENTSLETRRFPLELPCTAGTKETLRLTLDESVGAAASGSVPCSVTAPGYAFACSAVCSNGVLTAQRSERVADVNFDVPAYDALRNARKEVETAERDRPEFLSRPTDANLRVNTFRTVIHFTTPTVMVQTNIVEKEVLTYRGKQTASEIKISYAPSVRHVELVSATVSNRNGKVHHVTPKEINVMDCGWATKAPRYPASKILVANLPGVEIGSVIRYVTVLTTTNAPVAESFTYSFGGRDPYGLEEVEVHVPEGMRFAISNDRFPDADGSCRDKGASYAVETNAQGRVFRWTMRNLAAVPSESLQPPDGLWRPTFSLSAADWSEYGTALVDALARARGAAGFWPWSGDASRSEAVRRVGRTLAAGQDSPSARIHAILLHLRAQATTGPGLFELPFDQAFTAPDRVFADGYGSSPDRMNQLYAMLEAAGFDCAFVLVANDRHGFRGTEAGWRRTPRPGRFNTLAIRATWRSGWIPFLRDETEFWIANDTEYSRPEASSRFGDSYYDPQADAFGRILPDADATNEVSRADNFCRLDVRENGAVDFEVRNRTYGFTVSTLRRKYAELLPEMRARHYQKLLGEIAQNATATGELETDVEGYPFVLSFKAYAEGYAVVKGDSLRVTIPAFAGKVFGVDGARRRTPIALDGRSEVVETYEVVLPEGYTEIESLPEPFRMTNPLDRTETWLEHEAEHRIEHGRLHVIVRRRVEREKATFLTAEYAPFLDEWNRRAAAQAVRTIVVRRKVGKRN